MLMFGIFLVHFSNFLFFWETAFLVYCTLTTMELYESANALYKVKIFTKLFYILAWIFVQPLKLSIAVMFVMLKSMLS